MVRKEIVRKQRRERLRAYFPTAVSRLGYRDYLSRLESSRLGSLANVNALETLLIFPMEAGCALYGLDILSRDLRSVRAAKKKKDCST